MPAWLWPRQTAPATMTVRVGRVPHWASLLFAAVFIALASLDALLGNHETMNIVLTALVVLFVATLGRAVRYVLANE